jgi:hypothetical protein
VKEDLSDGGGEYLVRSSAISALRGVLTVTDQTVGEARSAVTGEQSEQDAKVVDTIQALTRQLGVIEQAFRQNSQALEANTKAALESTIGRIAGGVAETRQVAHGMSWGALGSAMSPIVRGILGLFRRKDEGTQVPLETYTPPAPIRLEAGVFEKREVVPVSYGQGAFPRATGSLSQSNTQPVVIQVQAMDSRSFVEHSEEIARAVREALLSNHMIHDAIRDV